MTFLLEEDNVVPCRGRVQAQDSVLALSEWFTGEIASGEVRKTLATATQKSQLLLTSHAPPLPGTCKENTRETGT